MTYAPARTPTYAAEVGVDDARQILYNLGCRSHYRDPVTGTVEERPLSRALLRSLALEGKIRGRKVSSAQTSAWLYDVEDLHRFASTPRNPVGNPNWIARRHRRNTT